MLADLVGDLLDQAEVDVALHVVECGDDGSVSNALREHDFAVARPGENLGYSGGNNLKIREVMNSDAPICLVNPDVRLPDRHTLQALHDALQTHPEMAAVAPSIRTEDGNIEYTGSEVQLTRALVVHTGTHLPNWPPEVPALVRMSWIDGACWMLRADALRDVGVFDEDYFLFSEEVDWCLRARQQGWRVAVLRDVEIGHVRSSSFGTSSKGAYYAWRNTYLLCKKFKGRGIWFFFWANNLLRFVAKRDHLRSGQAAAALRGGLDAIIGRTGRMRGDG
jgi:hypothetical protein